MVDQVLLRQEKLHIEEHAGKLENPEKEFIKIKANPLKHQSQQQQKVF